MADPACSVDEHRSRVVEGVTRLAPEVVPLADALGRRLAADVVATLSVPPFDHAAMDGFAVRAADLASVPVSLPVSGAVAAGDTVTPLEPGTAVRIMTGAPVPPGADLVVPFEWTSGSDPVEIRQRADAGRHIRFEGEDVRAGDIAASAGSWLPPARLGLLASVGATTVEVLARPRLGVISTGAELVEGHVPDSNTVMLSAAGRDLGAVVTAYGPAPDDPGRFLDVLRTAAEHSDLVVTTGGISAGDHDVVKAALRDDPAFWFGPVALKPGRPQGCGSVVTSDGRRVPVVTLPGTPIAAYAAFHLFVRAVLGRLAGDDAETRLARLGVAVEAGDRTVVLPAVYDENDDAVPLRGHTGHSQRLLARAEALLVVPPARRTLAAGTVLEAFPL
ncbi:gephyrin-like molybdotransferase Glp [Nocardioides sp. R1-1]|uniref:molybdopterin molybdotransferase MoeA n=1 Tax=Nocardioides sp. R1-1 TaxID=3383502 RepID=UPI0038D100E4